MVKVESKLKNVENPMILSYFWLCGSKKHFFHWPPWILAGNFSYELFPCYKSSFLTSMTLMDSQKHLYEIKMPGMEYVRGQSWVKIEKYGKFIIFWRIYKSSFYRENSSILVLLMQKWQNFKIYQILGYNILYRYKQCI